MPMLISVATTPEQQRQLRADQQTAEHIAAVFVGARQLMQAWRREPVADVHLVEGIGRDHLRQRSGDQQHQHDRAADDQCARQPRAAAARPGRRRQSTAPP